MHFSLGKLITLQASKASLFQTRSSSHWWIFHCKEGSAMIFTVSDMWWYGEQQRIWNRQQNAVKHGLHLHFWITSQYNSDPILKGVDKDRCFLKWYDKLTKKDSYCSTIKMERMLVCSISNNTHIQTEARLMTELELNSSANPPEKKKEKEKSTQ